MLELITGTQGRTVMLTLLVQPNTLLEHFEATVGVQRTTPAWKLGLLTSSFSQAATTSTGMIPSVA